MPFRPGGRSHKIDCLLDPEVDLTPTFCHFDPEVAHLLQLCHLFQELRIGLGLITDHFVSLGSTMTIPTTWTNFETVWQATTFIAFIHVEGIKCPPLFLIICYAVLKAFLRCLDMAEIKKEIWAVITKVMIFVENKT